MRKMLHLAIMLTACGQAPDETCGMDVRILPDTDPDVVAAYETAAERWTQATGCLVRAGVDIDSKSVAGSRPQLEGMNAYGERGPLCGNAEVLYRRSTGEYVRLRGMTLSTDQSLNCASYLQTAMHEFGHALGHREESQLSGGVMGALSTMLGSWPSHDEIATVCAVQGCPN